MRKRSSREKLKRKKTKKTVEILRVQAVLRSILRVIPKAALAEKLNPENPDASLGEIDRYLAGKHLMSRLKAFLIGEAFFELDVHWCSGLWMLWVCGHYEDVVATLMISTRLQPFNEPEVDAVWHMLALASRLARSTSLDELAPFPEHYVLGEGLPHPILDEINTWALSQQSAKNREEAHQTCIAFLERELAKLAWLNYAWFRRDFRRSFDIWCEEGTIKQRAVLDTVPLTAMALGRDTTLSLVSRELAILALVGHWLTCMETGFLYNLYPRPVRPEYLLERLIPEATLFRDAAGNVMDWTASRLIELWEQHPELVVPTMPKGQRRGA